jgi:hypothetical protein
MCVSHEARKAGADMMQCRKLSFATLGGRPIRFSPKKDIFFFQNFNFSHTFLIYHLSGYSSLCDGLKLIENVALCGRTHLDLFPNTSEMVNFFKLLPNLKRLVIYRCEMMRDHQEMIMKQKGRVRDWIAKRGAHLLIHEQLQICWDVFRLENQDFQAPAVTFMEIGDIEALKSSPEKWPMQR